MISLIWLYFVVKIKNGKEALWVLWHAYRHFSFAKVDIAFILSYLFVNPFRLVSRFLKARGEKEIYLYGETPLSTMDVIAKTCGITSKDVVFELGCGRGRTCFYLSQRYGCHVVGIDYIPVFIEKGNQIKRLFGIKNITFIQEDLFEADLKGATVVYCFGTSFSDEQVKHLCERLKRLPSGTKIITVSYPLEAFDPFPLFSTLKKFPVSFNWGDTDVYLQVVI